jgi:formylglycine-generating enzyme required for sulfatase activity
MSTDSTSNPVINQSGGINIHAETVIVQGDVVGRDKLDASIRATTTTGDSAQPVAFETQLQTYLHLLSEQPFRFPVKTSLNAALEEVAIVPRLSLRRDDLPGKLAPSESRPGPDPDGAFWENPAITQPRLLIVGEIGSGKTFLSQLMCCRLAQRFLEKTDCQIPLHVPLLELATHWQKQKDALDHTMTSYILQFVEHFFRATGKFDFPVAFWEKVFADQRALIIFDGLDEVPTVDRGTLLELIKKLQLDYPRLETVITLRPCAYDVDLFDRDCQLSYLLPFTPEQQQDIVQRLEKIERPALRNAARSQRKLEMFNGVLAAADLKNWLDRPLFLTAAYFQFSPDDNPLKSPEAAIQQSLLKLALQGWDDVKLTPVRARYGTATASFSTADRSRKDEGDRSRELLAFAGWQLYRQHETEISIEAVADWWRESDQSSSPRQARQLTEATILQIADRSQILAADPRKTVFLHEADKVYFAGCHFTDSDKTWAELVGYLSDRAFQPLLFIVHDLLAIQDLQLANDFLSVLLKQADQQTDRQLHAALVQLIADCLLRQKAGTPSLVHEAVINRILKIIEEDRQQSTALRARIALGRTLGALNDPRLEKKPMVFVPRGEFFMGYDLFPADRPARRVMVDDFYIDKYPVTNEQYRAFIEAGGYRAAQYWTPEGWAWVQATHRQQPKYWADPRFNLPNYPVVGVSWYEADAYARWAGKRLPAEQEWEKAARGSKYEPKTKRLSGQDWAWGNEFRSDYLNCAEGEDVVGGTTPIGIYPAGASPYGVFDMCGNVSEWTEDWYKPYPNSTDADSHFGEKYRVRRGGGWAADQDFVRCTCRVGSLPTSDYAVIGFRCCTREN